MYVVVYVVKLVYHFFFPVPVAPAVEAGADEGGGEVEAGKPGADGVAAPPAEADSSSCAGGV